MYEEDEEHIIKHTISMLGEKAGGLNVPMCYDNDTSHHTIATVITHKMSLINTLNIQNVFMD